MAGQPFDGPTYQLTYTDDVIGVELCAMMKNVAAIGLGMLDGIGKPTGEDFKNAKAALFTKAAHEIVDLVARLWRPRRDRVRAGRDRRPAGHLARRPQPALRRARGRRRATRRDPSRPRGPRPHRGRGRFDPRCGPFGRRTPTSTCRTMRPSTACCPMAPTLATSWRSCDESNCPTATWRWNSSASPRPPRSRPGRWVGRGDKIAADAAAVDAMRLMIDSVSMDGVVVIGEGEKDEAPMLFNGEQVGSGDGPRDRRRGRPDRRHDAHQRRAAERAVGDRARAARLDVLPGRRDVHGEDRDRARGGRRDRHRGAGGREHPPGREGQGQAARGGDGDDPRSPPPRRT